MKIGYFVANFPNQSSLHYGGSSLAAYYLAIEMAKRNHDVDIFTTSTDSKDHDERLENMKVHRYGTNLKLFTSNISIGMFKKPVIYDVDISHTHFDIPPGPLAGLKYAKEKKLPMIVTYHGDWIEDYGSLVRRFGIAVHNKILVDKILSYADIIISPSEHFINESKFLKKYSDKITVIPNGINLKDFDIPLSKEECRKKLGLPLDKNILLFLGYLSVHKCPDILIKAMENVLKNVPNSELIFVGDGIMRSGLEKQSERLCIREYIKFVGFVEDNLTKTLYYKSADIFVLPSFSECLPLVNLEAMACGIPIVASDVGGIPDIVKDGENGLLVPPMNPGILADTIIYLLKNDNLRKKMGDNGRNKAGNYSWDMITQRIEKLYNNILEL